MDSRSSRITVSGILPTLVALLLLNGCVYFNTVYLARRHFSEAELLREKAEEEHSPLPARAQQSYQKSLELATKVLIEYPDSEWVEEALLISQKALFRQGNLAASTRKSQELAQNFPESLYIPESRLYLARGLFGLGEYTSAVNEANQAAGSLTGRLRAEAILVQAQSLGEMEEYQEVIALLESLIEDEETPPGIVLNAKLELYTILATRSNHDEAAAVVETILSDLDLSMIVRQETTLLLIDSLLKAGRTDDVREQISNLQELDDIEYYAGVIKYFQALLISREGNLEESKNQMVLALSAGVTREWEARVRFDLASVLERKGDYHLACPEYQAIASGIGNPEQQAEAAGRVSAIIRLHTLRSLVSGAEDGLTFRDPRGGQAQAGTEPAGDVPPGMYLFLLAEHMALEMNQPDSTLVYLEYLEEKHPASDLIPRALYAVKEWLPAGAEYSTFREEAVNRLLNEYPESRWAYHYRKDIGEEPGKPLVIQAEEALLNAEQNVDLLAEPAQWRESFSGFFRVIEEFPDTEAARRAELTVARLLELGAGSVDSARVAYEHIMASYPGTPEAAAAAQRLGEEVAGLLSDPQATRTLTLEQETARWSNWFRTRPTARVTRLQPRSQVTQRAQIRTTRTRVTETIPPLP